MNGVGNNNPQVNNSGSVNHSDQTGKAQTGKSGTSTTRVAPSSKAIPAAQDSVPDTSIQSRKITTATGAEEEHRSPKAEQLNNALNQLKNKPKAKEHLQRLNEQLIRLKALNTELGQTLEMVNRLRRARADDSDQCKELMQREEWCKGQINKIRKECQKQQNKFNGSVRNAELKINVAELEVAMAPGTHLKAELTRAQESYDTYQQIIKALLPDLKISEEPKN